MLVAMQPGTKGEVHPIVKVPDESGEGNRGTWQGKSQEGSGVGAAASGSDHRGFKAMR